jgi:hypothetical protein
MATNPIAMERSGNPLLNLGVRWFIYYGVAQKESKTSSPNKPSSYEEISDPELSEEVIFSIC